MTEIRGHIRPTRRPGELGVHSLDHFHFVVPDLSVAQSFYDEFGLAVSTRGDGLALGVHGQHHVWGNICEGPRKRHQYVSFGAFEDDIDRFARRLQDMGVSRLDPPAGVDFEWTVVPRSRPQSRRDCGRAQDFAE